MDGLLNGQILLAGLYCALALNAVTAWVRFARPPEEPDGRGRSLFWRMTSAVLQTLTLPLVFVIVLLEPQAFSSLLGRAPNAELVIAVVLSLLVFVFLWRLFVELTRTMPALRRQRAEAALGRRLIQFARRRQGQLPPAVLIKPTTAQTTAQLPAISHARHTPLPAEWIDESLPPLPER
ncbi:MAG TPA: hypothetical protein VH393_17875 [Ktedonobacterales bacterium]|jgi:hypothetical protein